jgi:hypothetical protein
LSRDFPSSMAQQLPLLLPALKSTVIIPIITIKIPQFLLLSTLPLSRHLRIHIWKLYTRCQSNQSSAPTSVQAISTSQQPARFLAKSILAVDKCDLARSSFHFLPSRKLTRCHSSTSASRNQPTKAFSEMAVEYRLKDIASLASIQNLEKVESEVGGLEGAKVLVLRLNGEIHAISPRCTHYGAPLKLGVVQPDGQIRCPWHGGRRLASSSNLWKECKG